MCHVSIFIMRSLSNKMKYIHLWQKFSCWSHIRGISQWIHHIWGRPMGQEWLEGWGPLGERIFCCNPEAQSCQATKSHLVSPDSRLPGRVGQYHFLPWHTETNDNEWFIFESLDWMDDTRQRQHDGKVIRELTASYLISYKATTNQEPKFTVNKWIYCCLIHLPLFLGSGFAVQPQSNN